VWFVVIQRRLIWQGPIFVGLQDMGSDLSRNDSAVTVCNKVF